MALLQEYLDTSFETAIVEADQSSGKPRTYKLRGIFQRGDEPNGNKRIYPMKLLEREVERLSEGLKRRSIIGELDHPAGEERPRNAHASHVITNLEIRGKEIWGELEVIPGTDAGRNLMGLIEANIGLGVSSRGTGGLRPLPNGLFEVDESLRLNTWDVVHEPSVAQAYLHEGLSLNQKWAFNKDDEKSMLYYLENILY